jgi:purine-binding chemotaxis protein CheW
MASTKMNKSGMGEDSKEMIQLVTFNMGSEEFGVDILNVQEIIRLPEITRVPNSFDFVKGVVNLRGKIIPIIELRKRLSMKAIDNNESTRIIIIEFNDLTIGLIVDKVNEVADINKNITEPPPPMVGEIESDYIASVAKQSDRLIILLDLSTIFIKSEENNEDVLA